METLKLGMLLFKIINDEIFMKIIKINILHLFRLSKNNCENMKILKIEDCEIWKL